MRRIALLAIAVALILGIATPSMAVRPGREWDDPSRMSERGSGASGDDDLPSKDVSVPLGNPRPAGQRLESRGDAPQPKAMVLIRSFAIRLGWFRVVGQRTRVQP